MKKISHGGNIYKKAKEMGIREEDILDFSANISPLGLPEHIRQAMVKAIDQTINYPDPDCSRLKEAISKEDAVSETKIACGNGGADLLYRLAFGLQPKKVLLPAPAFVEYEEALSAAGAQIEYYRMTEDFIIKEDILEQITEDTDFVVICNPIIRQVFLQKENGFSEFLIGQKKQRRLCWSMNVSWKSVKMKKNIQ